jgi:hypothetical protein
MPDPYVLAVADIYNLRHLPGIAEVLGIDYDFALGGLLKWIKTIAKEVEGRHKGVKLAALSGDQVILAGYGADEVMEATVELVRESAARLGSHERRLTELALLRVGMSWHDDTRGKEFKGIQPGLMAYSLGDRSGVPPGTVRITKAVYDNLSSERQQEFAETGETSDQGPVFARQWQAARDSR